MKNLAYISAQKKHCIKKVCLKNQTQSFGRAGVESHGVELTSRTSYCKQLTDSEKMRKPIKANIPSFAQSNVN